MGLAWLGLAWLGATSHGSAWLGLEAKAAEWPPEVRSAMAPPRFRDAVPAVTRCRFSHASRPIIYRSGEGGKGCSLKGGGPSTCSAAAPACQESFRHIMLRLHFGMLPSLHVDEPS